VGGNLGDAILYSSVLEPIRERFPGAEIILIASPRALELFGRSPHVDRSIAADDLVRAPWFSRRTPRYLELARWTRWLWAPTLTVDTLIFPTHFVSPREIELLRVIKRREVVGCIRGTYIGVVGRRWERQVTDPFRFERSYRSRHVLDHVSDFLGKLGCPSADPCRLHVEIDSGEQDDLATAALTAQFAGRPYGMMFPGGNFRRDIKIWPWDRYGEVVELLGDSGPPCWIICGEASEVDDCRKVVESVQRARPEAQTIIACGHPLLHIAATLKNAQIALGADNGGTHLAVAVGTPTISIVSGAAGNLYFPWGDPEIQRAVMFPMDCWDCGYDCIKSSPLCIENITPYAVADECGSVLEAQRARLSPTGSG
jgi:ADP-heptose:LPS heptosyltransferase